MKDICSLYILPFFLAVPNEVPKLARVYMIVDFQQESVIELERTWELLHQLPEALNELGEHRRHLFGVPF